MQFCRTGHYMLLLLLIAFTTRSKSTIPSVKVNLHDSATLSCSERCSGLVRWSVFHKPTDVLAECDQTSCRSVKEGYQMIHDLYLKGNLSLTITEADFTKRGRYTCDCDGKDICDVRLLIEPLKTSIQIKPGESLILNLDISDPVEVHYNSAGAANQSSGHICTVDGRSTQCKDEYTHRVSSVLELKGMKQSDSGVYTIMDKKNDEVIRIYLVNILDDTETQRRIDKLNESCCSAPSGNQPCPCRDQEPSVPMWVFILVVILVAMACVVSVGVIVCLCTKNQQMGTEGNGNHVQNGLSMNEQGNHNPEEQQRLSPPNNDPEEV